MIVDILVLSVGALILYLRFAAMGLYPGDAGDLVTAAATHGVPHPPGYPLYTWVGFLLTRLPLFTVTWRMSLLSILPHIVVLLFAYALTYRLTKNRLASLFAALLLVGNYLFFLYSVTPEVFALLDLFVIGIFFLAVELNKRFSVRGFYAVCVLLGVALSHHTFIVLLFPSVAILLYTPVMKIILRDIRKLGVSAFCFLTGFLPYIYVYAAARGNAIINWDRPTTWERLFRLMTRADYGSFMSGSMVGHSFVQRLLNIKIYGIFVCEDFTWIGIMLGLLGMVWVWKKHRIVAVSWVTALFCMGPLFSFYSSFPILNRFVLATVERFLLPMYVLFVPLIAVGAAWVSQWVASLLMHTNEKRQQLSLLFLAIFFVLPLSIGGMNLWRFAGLRTDMTTDHYARDVLDSTPKNAILFLTRDTPLFSVQYMRYALSYRPDVMMLHLSRLNVPDYQDVIVHVFPALVIPKKIDEAGFTADFIKANARSYPVVSNVMIPVGDAWEWVPHGLVYVLMPKPSVPGLDEVIRDNAALWATYHNPKSGILSRYTHLFLTNVLDEYAISSTSYGSYVLRHGKLDDANVQFTRTIGYGSDTQSSTAYMYMGVARTLQNDCKGALDAYDQSDATDLGSNTALLYYRGITYRDCLKDTKKADEFFATYKAANRETEQPLEAPSQLPQ